MNTNLKVTPITVEQMLNRSEQDYNPSVWKQNVLKMQKYEKMQFYVIEPRAESNFEYARFFCSYIADGIYFFTSWSAYSASLTSNGFCQVVIRPDGQVEKFLFKNSQGKYGYAENCEANRKAFRNSGLLISNSI